MKAVIDPTAKIYPRVEIGEDTTVSENSIIGKPYRPMNGLTYESERPTKIGGNCYIGSFVTIGQGTSIGDSTIVEDYSKTETDVKIGTKCHLLYGAQICNEASVMNNCLIGGFVCERAKIGKNSRIFGQLTHSQIDPKRAWDTTEEPSPTIADNVFVGFGAMIIGGITVGRNVYVCAGAIVTKDVPHSHIARGFNEIVPPKDWKGCLSSSPFFRGCFNDEKKKGN